MVLWEMSQGRGKVPGSFDLLKAELVTGFEGPLCGPFSAVEKLTAPPPISHTFRKTLRSHCVFIRKSEAGLRAASRASHLLFSLMSPEKSNKMNHQS